MPLCDYGCGQQAIIKFKNGKWCCSTSHNKYPKMREKNSIGGKGHKLNNFEKLNYIDSNILCENGCGNIAKYITKYGKKYCSDNHRKCPINRKKNGDGQEGKIYLKGEDNKLFGRKRPEHSEYMKQNNPMFIDEHKQKVKDLTSTKKYKKEMSLKILEMYNKKPEIKELQSKFSRTRWKDEDFRKKIRQTMEFIGMWVPLEQLSELKKYRRNVAKYTNRSLKKYGYLINPDNLSIGRGISNNCYSVDHIFSVIEGFKQYVDPIIIGSIHNLQIILFRENSSKKDKCEITLHELKKRYYEDNI